MSLPKGKQQPNPQVLQSIPPQRPQSIPVTSRGNPSSVPIPGPDEFGQRTIPFPQQGNPSLRPSIHPHPLSANNSNPHDMSKQQIPTQPGIPTSNTQPVAQQIIYPQQYYSRQSRPMQNVNPRAPMNVNMNPQGANQPQQAYFQTQMPPNIMMPSHMPMTPQPMYVQSHQMPYRTSYAPQTTYTMQPQAQMYYTGATTPQYSAVCGAPAQSTAVYFQSAMVSRPQPPVQQVHPPPKKEKKYIRIQDPNSLQDVTESIVGGGSNSTTPPASGPSSARETPPSNPTPPPRTSEIAVQFATQVAVAAASDKELPNTNSRTTVTSDKPHTDVRETKSYVNTEGTSVKVIEKQSDSVLPQRLAAANDTKHQPNPSAVTRSSPNLPTVVSSIPPVGEINLLPIAVDVPAEPPKPLPVYVAPAVVIPVHKVETVVPPTVITAAEVIPAVVKDVPVVQKVPEVEEKPSVESHSKPSDSPQKSPEELSPKENGEVASSLESPEPLDKGELEGKDGRKQKSKRKQQLNQKGESKEGGEMDAFVDKGEVQVTRNAAPETNETEEMSVEEQRKVAEKNEENAKVSREYENNEEESLVIEDQQSDVTKTGPSLKYNYKEDQWSPLNPEGKRQYDRAFLLTMQSQPMSMKKPEGLPDLEVIKDTVGPRLVNKLKPFETAVRPPGPSGMRGSMGHVPDFTPGYVKSSTPRGGLLEGPPISVPRFQPPIRGRPSQQGKVPEQKGAPKKSFNLSINQEVKLNKSENAWRPARKVEKVEVKESETAQTEDLYRRVRGILNKLTPQKFQMLVGQVTDLTINTEERLKGVIDLVFEKAIDEPSFSVAYANLCKCLALMKVPVTGKENNEQPQYVNFRKLLLNKCQKEFERDYADDLEKQRRMKEYDATESVEKKKEILDEIDEMETKGKRRSLGNIRFIGELFKLNMLTAAIMHDCLKKLLNQKDEDSLECLCRLLTTIGKDMDNSEKEKGVKEQDNRMNGYFRNMADIITKKEVSARVRFMLQDVIELRSKNWIPRREDNNPKTIDQIHKEAQKEQQMERELLSQQPTHRRPDDRDKRKRNQAGPGSVGEDGWSTVGSKASRSIDPSKLKLYNFNEDIQLNPGGRNSVGWGRGSSGGGSRTNTQEPDNKPAVNRFQALAGSEQSFSDSRRVAARTPTPSGRDSSKGRGVHMLASNQRSNKPSVSNPKEWEREQAIAAVKTIAGGEVGGRPQPSDSRESSSSRDSSVQEDISVLKGDPNLTEHEVEEKTKPLLDEFIHNEDFDEAITCVREVFSPATVHLFVQSALNLLIERSRQARTQIGQLMHDLVKRKVMSVNQYIKGLAEFLTLAEDFVIDIPQLWEYLGECVSPLVKDGTIPMSSLAEASQPLYEAGLGGLFIEKVLCMLAKSLGHVKVGEMWQSSGLTWDKFLNSSIDQQKFLKEHGLEYTTTVIEHKVDKPYPLETAKEILTNLLSKKADNEEIFDWIDANIGEAQTQQSPFIRALITAVVKSSINDSNKALNEESLRLRRNLLIKYVDNKEEPELQALYATQALVHSLEHPQGLLGNIFKVFTEEEIIADETFHLWEATDNPSEMEGKGMAVGTVKHFLEMLKQGNESEES